jgi:capsular exopolysaccharide synthesis family protein
VNPAETGGAITLLRHLLSAVVRKWYLIVLATGLGGSGAWFYLANTPERYSAESLIEMSVRRPRIASQRGAISEDADLGSSSEEIFNTRIQKFMGTRLRGLVAVQLQTATNQPVLSREQVNEILHGVKFALIRRTYLVRVSCMATDPLLALVGANASAEAAVQLAMEQNRLSADGAVTWLEQQVNQQQKILEKITQRITAFREITRLDANLDQKAALQTSLLGISAQLTQLDGARILADKLLAAISKVKLDPKRVGDLPDTTPRREEIIQAVSKWLLALQERDGLLAKYTPEHPEVMARATTIVALGEQVTEAIKRAQSTAEANVHLLEQQTAGLRSNIEAQTQVLSALESKLLRTQSELGGLEREQTIAEVGYKGLLTRIEEARLAADENTATVKVVEPAVLIGVNGLSQRLLLLLLGLLLGLAGGLGLALLVEILEDRFIGTDDLERAVGLPVLGLVPRLQGKDRHATGRVVETDRFGRGAEVFAGIRSKIMSATTNPRSTCLLVTSSAPREGKTITAANLALSFARSGVRTLLVDFDLRRPAVSKVFGLPKDGPCLMEVLGRKKTESFAGLPQPTECADLFVIGNRASQDFSAAEIMGSQIARDFIAWARSSFELVIMDSPPFGVVSDSLVLAGMAEGVLFVNRPGISRRRMLRSMIEEFGDAGAPLLGVVVNGVKFGRLSALTHYDYLHGRAYQTYKYPATGDKG